MIEIKTHNDLPPCDGISLGDVYYFRQMFRCLKKEHCVGTSIILYLSSLMCRSLELN